MPAGGWTGWGNANSDVLASGSVVSGNIASGQVGRFAIASGAVKSGHVGSGAIKGSLGGGVFAIGSGTVGTPDIGFVNSGNIASGQIGRFHLSNSAVQSGAIGSGAVLASLGGGLRNIASGSVGPNDFGAGVFSGNIASGQVGRFHLSVDAVRSGAIGSGAVLASLGGGLRNIASGTIGPNDFNDVFSGNIASGQVGRFHLSIDAVQSGAIGSGTVLASLGGGPRGIASGTVGPNDFGSGAILSGNITSGAVGRFHLADKAVQSGIIASGAVLGAQGGGPRSIASGTVGPNDLGSGSVLSGAITSGAVGTGHFTSGAGATITNARNLVFNLYTTSETISGIRCAQITPSGLLRIAMAAVSGRMPANGIVVTNALSGAVATLIRFGDTLGVAAVMGSGLCISGRNGQSLWVGSSGQVVTASGGGPRIGVGATNSGALAQRVGTSSASGAILIDVVAQILLSGAAAITTDNVMWPAI